MIEILLISFYVLSVILCGYTYYTITIKELQKNSGIINAGILVSRVLLIFTPIINFIVSLAYFWYFLYNTEIKINIKIDKNEKMEALYKELRGE
jgi:predicted membrane protein